MGLHRPSPRHSTTIQSPPSPIPQQIISSRMTLSRSRDDAYLGQDDGLAFSSKWWTYPTTQGTKTNVQVRDLSQFYRNISLSLSLSPSPTTRMTPTITSPHPPSTPSSKLQYDTNRKLDVSAGLTLLVSSTSRAYAFHQNRRGQRRESFGKRPRR